MGREKKIIYLLIGSDAKIDIQVSEDTVWLTQWQMSELFGKDIHTIGLPIRNIYTEEELILGATTKESSVVQQEGG